MEDIIDLSMNIDDDDCVIESVIYNKHCINNYDKMKKEEPLFTEFLEECLKLENSAEMIKIINQLFVLKYNEADKNLKESSEFKCTLREIINSLKTDPRNKYKYMKQLSTVLNTKAKRRVQLVTLESKVVKASKSVSKVPVVNTLLTSNTTENKSEEKENKVLNTETKGINTSHSTPKQLGYTNENEHHKEEALLIPHRSIDLDRLKVTTSKSEKIQNELHKEDPLLVPHRVIDLERVNVSMSKSEKIQKIENEIKFCKHVIEKLDKEDVFTDSVNSPYIKSEKLKTKVVKLYKELCQLNGDDPVKKKEFQLKAMEGHPAGPVKRLEMFLNKSIEKENPPFPNFRDVVKCVLIANNEDGLGWSKAQIMQEATALFTYCGRALQKRRQKREYKDLISIVDGLDNDPADNDPELMIKLEANKRIAIKNEKEVFERFTMMQNLPGDKNTAKDLELDVACSSSDSDVSLKETRNINSNLSEDKLETETDVKIKKEPEMNIEELLNGLGDNYTTTVIDIEDSYLVIEIDSSDDE